MRYTILRSIDDVVLLGWKRELVGRATLDFTKRDISAY